MIVLLFFLLVVLSDAQNDLIFNRIRVTKNANNQVSVRMHVQSRELSLLHASIRFSSNVNVPHDALLIAQTSVNKYRPMLDEARRKIIVNTRGTYKRLSYVSLLDDSAVSDANRDGVSDKLYDLIQSTRLFGATSEGIAYDGILLLDFYSSIWQEYNMVIFEPGLLRFRFTLNQEDEITSLAHTRAFHAHTRIDCDLSVQEDACFVNGSDIDGLFIDQVHYPLYRLLVDLDSVTNLLPADVYFRWYRQDETDTNGPYLNISWQGRTLQLNRHFRYAMHESNLVILGVDLLHHFPCLVYTESHIDIFSFTPSEYDYDRHENVAMSLILFTTLLLACLFLWGTSYNYRVLRYVVRYSRYARVWFPFAFSQTLYESVAIIVASLLILVTSLFAGIDNADRAYHARKQLLILFTLAQASLLFLVALSHPESFKRAFRHYFTGWCRHHKTSERPYWSPIFSSITSSEEAEALYKDVVKEFHDPLILIPTQVVIARNLLFISVCMSSLVLLLNFYTPVNDLSLLVMILLSLVQIYYHVKYIAIGVLFLSLRKWYTHKIFLFFMALETIALGLWLVFAYEAIFVDYFNTINSTYSSVVVDAYLLTLVALAMYTAIFMVSSVFDKYADSLIDKVIYS